MTGVFTFLLLVAAPGLVCGALFTITRAQEPEVIHLPQAPTPPGQNARPQQGPRSASMNIQEVLGELWFRRKGYLEKGDVAAAGAQVQLMRDVIRREGLLNADDIAGAFLLDGARLLEAGSTQRALQSFHLANEFAPDRPDPLFAVGRALWKGEHDLWGALSATGQGLGASLRNPVSRVAYLGNFALIALAGTLLTALFWCLISAFRTARLAQHDLYENRVRSFSEAPAQTIAWVLWLLPALVWMAGWWALVYWLALGTAYMKRSERLVSLAACLCCLTALPLLGWITRQSAVTTDPAGRLLLEVGRGRIDREQIPALEQMVGAHPEESLYRFLLAQTYHATGSPKAALQEYRRVQEEDPGNAFAWINAGNLYFEQSQYAQAAEEYERAIQLNPRLAMAYFNLHLARQQTLRLEDADVAFRRARELDNALVTSILATGGEEGKRSPVEARYAGEDILVRIQRRPGRIRVLSVSREFSDPLSLAGGVGLLGCLIFSWPGRRWGLGSAQRCGRCGRPFCRRCQVGTPREEGYCTACRHLYILKDPVAPKVREEREKLVAAHERWQWISRRLVSLVLPGAGQVQGGRTFLGICLTWLACLAVSSLFISGRFLAFPRVATVDLGSWVRVGAVTLFALAWFAGNALAFERKS